MKAKEFNNIIYDKDDQTGIVLVSINRPEIKNALTILVLLELYQAAELFEKDETAMAMILTGAKAADSDDPAKEAFSSGGYFNPADLEALDEETRAEIDLTDIAQKKLCLKLWQSNKPIIAAINGLAIGAGITLPLVGADLIYASEDAWFGFYFVKRAVVPEFGNDFILPFYVFALLHSYPQLHNA